MRLLRSWARRQNFFRQVLGNHGLAGGILRLGGYRSGFRIESLAAFFAKLGARPVRFLAVRTDRFKRRTTLVAEDGVLGAFTMAMRADHS